MTDKMLSRKLFGPRHFLRMENLGLRREVKNNNGLVIGKLYNDDLFCF